MTVFGTNFADLEGRWQCLGQVLMFICWRESKVFTQFHIGDRFEERSSSHKLFIWAIGLFVHRWKSLNLLFCYVVHYYKLQKRTNSNADLKQCLINCCPDFYMPVNNIADWENILPAALRKKWNVLFNNALDTFYLWLYGIGPFL